MWPFLGYTPVSDAPTHTEISSCDEDAPNAGLCALKKSWTSWPPALFFGSFVDPHQCHWGQVDWGQVDIKGATFKGIGRNLCALPWNCLRALSTTNKTYSNHTVIKCHKYIVPI